MKLAIRRVRGGALATLLALLLGLLACWSLSEEPPAEAAPAELEAGDPDLARAREGVAFEPSSAAAAASAPADRPEPRRPNPGPTGPLPPWMLGDTGEPDPGASAQVWVRGRVVGPSGAPVEGVRVCEFGLTALSYYIDDGQAVQQAPPPTPLAITDAEGRFEIRHPETLLGLTLMPPKQSDLLDDTVTLGPRQGSAEQARELGDLVLRAGARIEGFVLDAAGAPLAGAEVYLDDERSAASGWNVTSVDAGRSVIVLGGQEFNPDIATSGGVRVRHIQLPATRVRTDERGHFVIHQVAPGPHSLYATKEGHWADQEDGVACSAGQTTSARLQLGRAAALVVEVVDARGAPIEGAAVVPSRGQVVHTDAAGRVELGALSERYFGARILAAGYLEHGFEGGVLSGDQRTLRVALARAATLRARVEVASPPNLDGEQIENLSPELAAALLRVAAEQRAAAQVLLCPRAGGTRSSVTVLADGRFEFSDVAPGHYELQLQEHTRLRSLGFCELRPGEQDLGLLVPGPEVEPLRVRVRDARGRPVQGALVEHRLLQGQTEREPGLYELQGLPSGPRTLTIALPSGTRVLQRVVLPERGGELDLQVELGAEVLIVARGGAPVGLVELVDDAERVVASLPLSGERTALFEVAPGRYRARYGAGVAASSVPVEAQPGQRTRVELPAIDSGSLRCQVLDPAGLPLVGASVAVGLFIRQGEVEVRASSYSVSTDAEGRFALTDLAPGSYAVQVSSEGRELTFRVEVRGAVQRKLRLPAERGVPVRVEFAAAGEPATATQVELRGEGELAHSLRLTSDAAGRATFLSVPPGRYRLRATRAGRRLEREVEIGPSPLDLRLSF